MPSKERSWQRLMNKVEPLPVHAMAGLKLTTGKKHLLFTKTEGGQDGIGNGLIYQVKRRLYNG